MEDINKLDEVLLDELRRIELDKRKRRIEPSFVLFNELREIIKNSLNRLYKSGEIEVGDTMNDKYLRVKNGKRTQ